jgi:tetratricopeptide (TPR) repeat protein
MRSGSKFIASLLLASAFAVADTFAGSGSVCFTTPIQQGVGKGPIAVPRDPELEKQSARNLEVAKFYFYKRKPDKNDKDGWMRLNKAVESRLTEIMDTNPTYARMIEVYFMLGEVYKRMGDLDKAAEYWDKAVKENSDEKIKSEAQKRLDESKNKDKK